MAQNAPGPDAKGLLAAAVVASLLSGAAALVYQVLWTRRLGLVLGTTVAASAVALAAFMAGLGLGAALAARRIDGVRRLAAFYAALEVGIAVLASLVGPLCAAFPRWLAALYQDGEGSASALTLARIAASAAALLPPATLMGATLPALAALVAREPGRLGRTGGALYAANTLGAIAGSLGAALFLLPSLGMSGATAVAAGLNVAAAALVFWRGAAPSGDAGQEEAALGLEAAAPRIKKKRGRPEAAVSAAGVPVEASAKSLLMQRAVLIALALSGAGALVNEVAWTRAFVLLIGPTAYAFAFVVAAVIAGLAAGSAVAAARADKSRSPARALGLVELAAAAACLGVVTVLGRLPVEVAEMVRAHLGHPEDLLLRELLGVAALLALPSLLFGAAFPLALAALQEGTRPGRVVGLASAWNTSGAIVGALAAGFLLIPHLGLQRTLEVAALVHGLAGLLLLAAVSTRARLVALPALALAAGGLFLPRWDPELMTAGAYKYAAYADGADLEGALRGGRLLYVKEGAAGTVSVRRRGSTVSLAVDGKVDATSSGDMMTQRLLAQIPLALHPDPRRVLVVGYGSGVTAGTALSWPQAAVDAVEISPEVVEASAFFDHVNGRPRENQRLRLLVQDARNHLLLSRRPYDVIVSEPSNPWMAGVSSLFTRDFFRLGRERLAEGGLFGQWIHVYNLAPDDLRTVIASFTDVFGSAALFELNEGDVLLLGSRDAFPTPEEAAFLSRLRELGLEEREAVAVSSLFRLGGPALVRAGAEASRHTDDRPVLEFRAARSLWADTALENHRLLREASRGAALPEPFAALQASLRAEDLAARGRMMERAHSYSWAFDAFRDALQADPSLLSAHEGLVRSAVKAGRGDEAAAVLDPLAAPPGTAAARIGRALLAHNQDRPEQAMGLLTDALRVDPRSVRARLLAAEIQAAAGNVPAVAGLARQALALDPGNPEAEAFVAWTLLAEGQAQAALERCREVLARRTDSPRALEVAALASAASRNAEEARRHFRALIALEPEAAGYLVQFGSFELGAGDAAAALDLFEQAVEVDPKDQAGWQGLREAARAARNPHQEERASRVLRSRGLP